MNDRTFADLGAYVDTAVLPLRARPRRKRRMREELLAHLLGIYDEEFARLADERVAAGAAKQRLGDVSELTNDLQASVPFLERTVFSVLKQRERIMWRWLFVLGCVAVLVGLGFVFPALAQLRHQGHLLALEAGLLVLGVVLTLGGLGSVGFGVKAFRTRSS